MKRGSFLLGFLALIFLLMFSVSCSNKNTTKSSFKLSYAHLYLTTPMNGGVFLRHKNTLTNNTVTGNLGTNDYVDLAPGTYDFLFVTFQGPNLLAGTMYCGSSLGTKVEGTETSVTINLSTANCSNPLFLDFINELLKGIWDQSTFDQSLWSE